MDRRTFLKTASAAGAGAAFGMGAGPDGAGASPVKEAPWDAGKAPSVSQGLPDVLVVGAGVFGIFNAMNLQRLGASVLVVDQYGPGNSRATSGGETRGVRTSYGDRDHGHLWMDWADEAIRRWQALDEEWAEHQHAPLFYQTGDLIMRDETSPYIEQTREWWDERDMEYEVLDADEIRYRWPVINVETVNIALHEPRAGVIRIRKACETVAKVFQNEGGSIRIGKATIGGHIDDMLYDVELTPSGDRLRAGQYVFALGPWFPKIMPEVMGRRMRVRTLGHVVYFGTPPGDDRFSFPNLPSYGVPGCTGWPALPPDYRGLRVRTGGHSEDDPDTSSRHVPMEDIEQRPRSILRQWFPDMLFAPVLETRACHYESSMSRNFIVDRHPEYGNVWITGGGSAEAAKQGPVLGEYLARRVLGLETDPVYDEAFRLPEVEEEDPGELAPDME